MHRVNSLVDLGQWFSCWSLHARLSLSGRCRLHQIWMRLATKIRSISLMWLWPYRFVAPEGRKVTSLKRRVRSQLARGEMKKCTPSWCEAHFEVKMYKAHQLRTTFGSWAVEKVHAVVARSTFPSQKCENPRSQTTFGSWDVEKVHVVVARNTLPSQKCKKPRVLRLFWRQDVEKVDTD